MESPPRPLACFKLIAQGRQTEPHSTTRTRVYGVRIKLLDANYRYIGFRFNFEERRNGLITSFDQLRGPIPRLRGLFGR